MSVKNNQQKQKTTPSKFIPPSDFLFGVSNSGYQAEGGYNQNGQPHNNWAQWEQSGKVETTGKSCRFWEDYQGHIDLAKSIGMNAFRFGIDWTRLQPTYNNRPSPPPEWDQAALDHYAKITAAVMDAGMEPQISLHHFVHPAWLGLDLWADDGKACIWADYALKVVREINRRLIESLKRSVKYLITMNEPNLFPLATYIACEFPQAFKGFKWARRGWDNMLLAHIHVYDGIHDLYEDEDWETPMVTFNVYCLSIYEFDRFFYDIMRAREVGVAKADLKDFFKQRRKDWNQKLLDYARIRWPDNRFQVWNYRIYRAIVSRLFSPLQKEKTIEAIYASKRKKKIDYLALDIYDPFIVGTFYLKLPTPRRIREKEPLLRPPWWEWHLDGQQFGAMIRAHHAGNDDIPIFIQETGMGHRQTQYGKAIPRRDGLSRERFLRFSIGEVTKAIREGIPIKGYVYWSLVDNYEWGSFETRLGLYGFDHKTSRIKNTDGFGVDSGKIYKNLVDSFFSGNEDRIVTDFEL